MQTQHRNVLVLSACQATLQTSGATMIAVTGLAGYALAEDKSFATVPLTCYVLGSAVTTIPASLFMKSVGRRTGFQTGTATGRRKRRLPRSKTPFPGTGARIASTAPKPAPTGC
jgi:hypothetical protein